MEKIQANVCFDVIFLYENNIRTCFFMHVLLYFLLLVLTFTPYYIIIIALILPPQVIAFIDALLSVEKSGIERVLVLAPVNTLHNWMNEFQKWIPYDKCDYHVRILSSVLGALSVV